MRLIKKLGQNLLSDKNILRREAALAKVKGRVVLEIGAGDGRLTEELLAQNPSKIYAVEKDGRFASLLREKFKNEKRLAIIENDFLDAKFPGDVDIVVGNIPYYISSKIIFRLKDEKIERALLMVQKEFAEKMVAKPNSKNYGRLSATAQIFFDVEMLFKVPARLFIPKPKVDSALVLLRPKGTKLSGQEEELIRRMFQQKNKKIRNIIPNPPPEWMDKRPRQLSPDEVLRFVRAYSENSSAS